MDLPPEDEDEGRLDEDDEGPEPESPGRGERRGGAPPESTGREVQYLNRRKEAKTPMRVVLRTGEEVRGWIEYYDRDMIKINRTDGPNLFIRKTSIRLRNASESPARAPQTFILQAELNALTTSGWPASCKTTKSGSQALITAARGFSLPTPP